MIVEKAEQDINGECDQPVVVITLTKLEASRLYTELDYMDDFRCIPMLKKLYDNL